LRTDKEEKGMKERKGRPMAVILAAMVLCVLVALNMSGAATTVVPEAVQAGGLVMLDVPLSEGDLPEGWHLLPLDEEHVAVSVAPDAEAGEYEIGAMGHWHLVDGAWWCGDDDLGTYDDYYYDALVFEDLAIDETTNAMAVNHYIHAENKFDGGNVQVSTDDGTTWTLLTPADGYDYDPVSALGDAGFTSYYGYAADDYFDLSAYEGMTVDIQFVFASDYSIHYYDGWYIYSVELGTLETIFVPAEWTVLNLGDDPNGDTWEWWEGYFGNMARCNDGSYDEYQDEWMISPAIDLTGAAGTELTFQHDMYYWSYDTDPNYVMVSTTDTDPASFTPVWSIMYPDPDPNNAYEVIDLSAYDGETIYVAWVLQSTWGEQWQVDNIAVYDDDATYLAENFDESPFASSTEYVFTAAADITYDVAPGATVVVTGKLTGGELADYRHSQNAMRAIVVLYLNIEHGYVEDDGTLGAAIDAYMAGDYQAAQTTANVGGGYGYGYWANEGGYGYFLNPGDNGKN